MPKKKTISKDVPLLEITLRRYEKPANLDDRELVRKLCLSLGLLQPGDSRDIVVDVLHVLIKARREQRNMTSEEACKRVIDERKRQNLPMYGIAASNVRRQLKRLRDLYLIEKRLNAYRITEFGSLEEIFDEKIEKFIVQSIISRVKEYLKRIDETKK